MQGVIYNSAGQYDKAIGHGLRAKQIYELIYPDAKKGGNAYMRSINKNVAVARRNKQNSGGGGCSVM